MNFGDPRFLFLLWALPLVAVLMVFAFRRRLVSFIFQSFNIFPGLTAISWYRTGKTIVNRTDFHDSDAVAG